MTGMQPSQPYVVMKPGGLSQTAHIVHILVAFLTCGLWLPFYILFIALAPTKRAEVIAPYGTDPALINQMRMEAETLTPDERKAANRRTLIILAVAASPLLALGLVLWISSLAG